MCSFFEIQREIRSILRLADFIVLNLLSWKLFQSFCLCFYYVALWTLFHKNCLYRVKRGNSGTLRYFSNFAYTSGFMQHRYGALASSIILLWSNALCVSIGHIYFSTSDFVNVTLCRNYPIYMVISAPSAIITAPLPELTASQKMMHNNSNIY